MGNTQLTWDRIEDLFKKEAKLNMLLDILFCGAKYGYCDNRLSFNDDALSLLLMSIEPGRFDAVFESRKADYEAKKREEEERG